MVEVSSEKIGQLGKEFEGWSTRWLDPAIKSLSSLSVVPGKFPDGEALKTCVENRTTSLRTNLNGLKKANDAIATDLSLVAKKYEHTEKESDTKASDLDQMVTDVGKVLPGFGEKS